MVRAPCCEKMGVKRGPWTPEEDQVLISYIQKYGHGNWRALPKKAGLLRCGKSCRLRWINYLRPDIKRGNFSWEEEETIIKLHERLGNRWSAIAAQLPGRTDNEIKNVWHTHLKKRLKQKPDSVTNGHVVTIPKCDPDLANDQLDSANSSIPARQEFEAAGYSQMSPQSSSSCDRSLVTEASVSTAETEINMATGNGETFESSEIFPIIDENFWSEPDNSSMENNLFDELLAQFPDLMEPIIDDGKDFWYNLFVKAGGIDG